MMEKSLYLRNILIYIYISILRIDTYRRQINILIFFLLYTIINYENAIAVNPSSGGDKKLDKSTFKEKRKQAKVEGCLETFEKELEKEEKERKKSKYKKKSKLSEDRRKKLVQSQKITKCHKKSKDFQKRQQNTTASGESASVFPSTSHSSIIENQEHPPSTPSWIPKDEDSEESSLCNDDHISLYRYVGENPPRTPGREEEYISSSLSGMDLTTTMEQKSSILSPSQQEITLFLTVVPESEYSTGIYQNIQETQKQSLSSNKSNNTSLIPTKLKEKKGKLPKDQVLEMQKRRNEFKMRLEQAKKQGNLEEIEKEIEQEKKELRKQQKAKYKAKKQLEKLAMLSEAERKKSLALSERKRAYHERTKKSEQRKEQARLEGKLEDFEKELEKEEKERKELIKKEKSQRKAKKQLEKLAMLPEAERKKRLVLSQRTTEYHKRTKEREQKQAKQEGKLEKVKKLEEINKDSLTDAKQKKIEAIRQAKLEAKKRKEEIKQRKEQAKLEGRLEAFEKELEKEEKERKELKKKNKAQYISQYKAKKQLEKLAMLPEAERKKRLTLSQRTTEYHKRTKEKEQRQEQAKLEGRLEAFEKELEKEEKERKELQYKKKLQWHSQHGAKKLVERLATLPADERKKRILQSQRIAVYHKKLKEKKQKEEQQGLQEAQKDTGGVPTSGGDQRKLQELQGDTATSILSTPESTPLSPLQSSVIESSEEQLIIDIEDWDPMFEVLLSDLSTENIDWDPIFCALEKESYISPGSVDSCENFEKKTPAIPDSMPPLESSEDEEEAYDASSGKQRLPQKEPPTSSSLQLEEKKEDNDDNKGSTSPTPKKRLKTTTASPSQGSLRASHREDTAFIPGYNHEAQLGSLVSLQCVLGGTIEQTSTKLKNLVLQMRSHILQDYNKLTSLNVCCSDESKNSIGFSYKNAIAPKKQGITLTSLKTLWLPYKTLHVFGESDNYTTNLEYKIRSGYIGLMMSPLPTLSLGLSYSRYKDQTEIFHELALKSSIGLAKSYIATDGLSFIALWNIEHPGFTGHLASCYDWGQIKNTRYVTHADTEIKAKGTPDTSLSGKLGQFGYNMLLSSSLIVTPYIEVIHIDIKWTPYNEYIGVLPCKIGNHKEKLWSKSIGIHTAWKSKDQDTCQAWITCRSRQHTISGITSIPLMNSNSLYKIFAPEMKKKYTEYEAGIFYTIKYTETFDISLRGSICFRKSLVQDSHRAGFCLRYFF